MRPPSARVYTIAVKRARVLAVDDEEAHLEIISRYLTALGHSVTLAADAADARARLTSGAFDLVLLDLILPGMTGLQALPEFRKLTKAPIHVMSGQNDEDVREDLRLLGAAGFFPKPLDLGAIATLLASLPEPGA